MSNENKGQKSLTFRVEEELYKEFKEVCNENARTVSGAIRKHIQEVIDEAKKEKKSLIA